MEKVREAVVEYGVPWTDDFNTGENFGCGHYQINQEKGDRWSTADGFLGEEVRSRDNLKVYTGMEVDRLIV
jgi:choline dehydrogenase